MAAYRHMREIVATTLNSKGNHAFRSGKAVNTTVLINDLIVDLCQQSTPEKGLCFSEEYFNFILEIKKFNFAHIYNHWRLKEFSYYADNCLQTIFRTLMRYYEYAKNGRMAQALKYYPVLGKTFVEWLIKYTNYRPITWKTEMDRKKILRLNTVQVFNLNDIGSYIKCVVEFISGMTDVFAIQVYDEIISF